MENIVQDFRENYGNGWLCLYRSLSKKGWYKKSDYVHLWIHLLIKANYKDTQNWFNGKLITINKGQLITTRKELSYETGIQNSKIERVLKCLEIEQQIEQQKTNTSRLISILNYDKYQSGEQRNEQQVNNERTTSENIHYYNINNINNNNNINNLIDFEKLLEYFNKITGKKTRVITQKTKDQIKARLKEGFSKEDIASAIKNCYEDKFHIAENHKHLTLEFITRPAKLERYSQKVQIKTNIVA
jgi:uncharacterized phage protein (TIGR02220 family)